MKKFAFRLQRVLDIRAAREKLKLADFGREQQRLAAEWEKLNLFTGEKELQLTEMRASASEPFAAWSQHTSCRYLQRIGRVIEFQQGRVEAQSQAVEGARERYIDARRDTQALEKLRETHLRDWTGEWLRDEGRILDEVGSRKRASSE